MVAVGSVAAFATVALAGCGGIDTSEAEDLFQEAVEDLIDEFGADATVESVECPDDIDNEEGEEFECEAEVSDGSTVTGTGEVIDDSDGTVIFRPEDFEGMSP